MPAIREVWLAAGHKDGILDVRCIDGFGEDTDILAGHLLLVRSLGVHDGNIRLRTKDDDPWSQQLLVQVAKQDDGQFGVRVPVTVENPGAACTLILSVYATADTHITTVPYKEKGRGPRVHSKGS